MHKAQKQKQNITMNNETLRAEIAAERQRNMSCNALIDTLHSVIRDRDAVIALLPNATIAATTAVNLHSVIRERDAEIARLKEQLPKGMGLRAELADARAQIRELTKGEKTP